MYRKYTSNKKARKKRTCINKIFYFIRIIIYSIGRNIRVVVIGSKLLQRNQKLAIEKKLNSPVKSLKKDTLFVMITLQEMITLTHNLTLLKNCNKCK